MRILLLGTWHRRCGLPYYYLRALRQLGHEVVTVGPWRDQEPWGTRGREPQAFLNTSMPVPWRETIAVLNFTEPLDCAIIASGGEGLRWADGDLPDIPWAHIDSEGAAMEWSRGLTPHRYAEIMCNGADAGVQWLPKAFDADEHWIPPYCASFSGASREYDLVQLASAREARQHIWHTVRERAPDIHTFFGDVWGPLYACAYQNSLATYCCSTLDFVTTRVFEAMAMGCVVIADRNPSTLKLFNDGEHFIGFDPIPGPGGEGMPDPEWLIDTVRRLRREGDGGMAQRAYELVRGRDSYQHRLRRVLEGMGLR
jgi:glycosyltransferase involved in cell wall biosynthesis